MIRALILAVLLIGGAAHAADQASTPMLFVAGKLQIDSSRDGFLSSSSSLTCSSSPGRILVDSTADTLSYCSSGGSTVKYAALGDDNGDATGIAPNTINAGDIQSGVIPPSKMTESFIQSYAGTSLTFDTTTSPDSLKVANDGVTLGVQTQGNYVATIAGTSNEVSVSGSGSESAAVTVGLPSAIDLGGKTSFEVPNGASPTTNVFGQIAGDNDAWAASRGAPQWYDGTANTYLVGALASDTPANGQVPKYNTGGTVTWENDSGADGHQVTAASLGLHCDRSTDDTATLRTALQTGGAAAGKALFIPSGCKILLGAYVTGSSVADVASNTSIECEDSTAGFVLARQSCSSGSDTPGAACTANNQCANGTCVADPGGPFAGTEASTYTVFGAAVGTSGQAIRHCGIWVNGGSGDSLAMGGAGKRWGYCDGSGGSDVTGEGCYNACNSSSGSYEGFACLTNADCGAGSCTARAGGCKAGGGSCVAVPWATNWGASGPGKIHPISWALATKVTVEDVAIYDHRRGDYSIYVGTDGRIIGSSNNGDTLTTSQAAGQIFGATMYEGGATRICLAPNRCFTPTVARGLIADGAGSRITSSTGYGWAAGINAKNFAMVETSTGGGYGAEDVSGWNGNTDLLISGPGVMVDGFQGGGSNGSLYCVMPEFGSGYNFLVERAFCDGNKGPKFIITGAGNQYMGVRGAWSGRGVIGLGDQRGRCAGGSRSGKVCIFEAGTDATIGCPSSTCNPHADFPTGSATHFVVGGGSLLHSDIANVAYVRAASGKRCTDSGGPCSVDGDCANTTCRALRYTEGSFSDVLFFKGGSGQTAIDLSASGIGVNQSSVAAGGGPSIENWLVSISATGFASGIKFPTLARACVGGTNPGASCTADATCTGSGACRGPVEKFAAFGNVGGVTTPLTNFDASYGDVSGLTGLLVSDDQGTATTYTAGEALSRGQLVKLSTTADQVVKVATTDTGEQSVGFVMADALSGYPVRVMRTGTTACITDSGTIAAGDLLERATGTAGRVKTSDSSADNIVGTAMEADGSTGSTFRCAVRPPAVQSSAATPFQTQYLTADAATQTADTVVNTQFSFTLSANKTYILDGALIVTGGSTGDMRCNLDGPASMTTVIHGYNNGTTLTVSGDNTDGKCVDIVASVDNVVGVGGLVVTGASGGTLDWKWAQNVSNGIGTTVKAGSWMRIMER